MSARYVISGFLDDVKTVLLFVVLWSLEWRFRAAQSRIWDFGLCGLTIRLAGRCVPICLLVAGSLISG